jgi:hypothetical protein
MNHVHLELKVAAGVLDMLFWMSGEGPNDLGDNIRLVIMEARNRVEGVIDEISDKTFKIFGKNEGPKYDLDPHLVNTLKAIPPDKLGPFLFIAEHVRNGGNFNWHPVVCETSDRMMDGKKRYGPGTRDGS